MARLGVVAPEPTIPRTRVRWATTRQVCSPGMPTCMCVRVYVCVSVRVCAQGITQLVGHHGANDAAASIGFIIGTQHTHTHTHIHN